MSTVFNPLPKSSSSQDVTLLKQQMTRLTRKIDDQQTNFTAIQDDLAKASANGVGDTLVRRDANKDFGGNKLKCYHLESAANTLNIGHDNQTTTLNIANAANPQTVNVGNNGSGTTTINLGGGTDQVKVNLPLKNSAGANILATGTSTVLVGKNVMPAFTSGSANTALGDNIALAPVSAVSNTFVGSEVARYAGDNISWNTGIGNRSLLNVKSNNNTAIGHGTLHQLTTGANNVSIGVNAGHLTSGYNCTFIGAISKAGSDSQFNSTAIGANAIVDADNTIQLGNASIVAVKTSGTLTAAGLESTGSTLNIASNNNTSTVNLGSGSGVQTINVGNNGAGVTTINLGGAGDTVNISGVLNNITTTNTQVKDKSLVLNSGGTASTAGQAGLYFEEAGDSSNSYVRVSEDRSKIELKAPTGNAISLNQSLQTTDSVDFAHTTTNSLLVNSWRTPVGQASQGASIGWNRTGGSGRTTFVNHQGLSTGGWDWINYGNSGPTPSASPQMVLDRSGNLAVTGTVSSSAAPTTNDHLTNKAYVDSKVAPTINQSLNTTDIATFAGVKFPTLGGTPAVLNFYEEYNMDMAWSDTVGTTPISIVRVGRMVTLTSRRMINFGTGTLKTEGGIRGLTGIPFRFCPSGTAHSIEQIVGLTLNATPGLGKFILLTHADGGSWSIWIRPHHKSVFAESDVGSVERFTLSWTIEHF